MSELRKTIHRSKSLLWGTSVALSWTWGIGIFFSVQMAVQFGLIGLLSFAFINASGLLLFGFYTQRIANRFTSPRHFEDYFFKTAKGLRGSVFLYQMLAIIITLFAVLKYLFAPMGFFLPLVSLMILGLTFFLGEEFNITRIKYLHGLVMIGVLACMLVMLIFVLPQAVLSDSEIQKLLVMPSVDASSGIAANLERGGAHILRVFSLEGHESVTGNWYFLCLLIPIAVGFFLGPWLDLQQWQRAVQINKEGLSIVGSYVCGAIVFFAILVFHGFLGLVLFKGAGGLLSQPAADGLFHAKDVVMRHFLRPGGTALPFAGFYIGFICLLALTTLDSGYIALRWFFEDIVKRSNNTLLGLIPSKLITSPLSYFTVATIIALVCAYSPIELEYIMSFYATFLVGYIAVLYRKSMLDLPNLHIPQMKLLAVGLFSIALFGLGYFKQIGFLMAIASLAPFFYGVLLTSKSWQASETKRSGARADSEGETVDATSEGTEMSRDAKAPARRGTAAAGEAQVPATIDGGSMLPAGASPVGLSTYFEGKWFVHEFVATYSDTNSVGNVYFGMYALWVGKTRELFFRHAMPDFDLKTTDYLILTRQFEHKFITEAREFDQIKVRIRIASSNRKFCTLEHQVLNTQEQLLGKGSQTLLFVSAKDYHILDIPQQVHAAFVQYV